METKKTVREILFGRILIICIFSIAMAALEGAVVVYLRALYYPDGFTVAMKMIDQRILLIEIAREIATIIMLLAIGYLAAKSLKDRFAYFLLSFAIWDIFYYIWLYVFIGWPSSVFEWDILFLIPFTWLSPVLAPVICSVTMIVLALIILRSAKIPFPIWSLLITGSLCILYTFLKDYGNIIITNGFFKEYTTILQNKHFVAIASEYIPQTYGWTIFIIGELFILIGILKLNYIRHSWKGRLALDTETIPGQ